MGVVIRPATARDAAGMAAVHVASWRTTYPGMLPDRYLIGLDPRLYAERWGRVLADARGARGCFIADGQGADGQGEGIVGFGWCGRQRSRIEGYAGEFYALYLLDDAQGQGIGRRLMAAMAESLLEWGIDTALVWVLKDNPSRWFYERLGGTRIAEHPMRFAGADLIEVAYGWRDLHPLARLSAGPQVR